MLHLKSFISVFLCILLMFVSIASSAQTLAELQRDNKVQVKVWVEPEDNIIARQQVNLQIEVATDKWFSGGTQIGRFEIADAIVLQREKFAVNSTRNEGEKSWAVQLWTLAVYPLRDGVFDVPAIPLRLSVAGENLEAIVGETSTRAFSFVATMPEQVTADNNWIATSRFEIDESFDKALDELAPGDALIRTIKMSADDLPAMMLPEVVIGDIPGIAVYAKPPQLTDKVNRGDYIAGRTQTFTYVFEKAGEYLLPKQTYFWWNLEAQSYESIELDEHRLTINYIANKPDSGERSSTRIDNNNIAELLSLLMKTGVALLLALGMWISVRRYRTTNKNNKSGKPVRYTEAGLLKHFEQACAQKDPEKALALFYQWLDFYGGESFDGSVRKYLKEMNQTELMTIFKDIMQSIYTHEKNNKVDLKLFASQYISELKKSRRHSLLDHLSVDLKLN